MIAAYRSCQAMDVKPAALSSWSARLRVRALPRRPAISVGASKRENWSTSTSWAPSHENSGALVQASQLVRPVVERRSRDDEVEGAVAIGQALGGPDRELQALVAGRRCGCLDHGRSRIDARKVPCLRALLREPPEQVSGAAAYVEHSPGSCMGVECEVRRPVGNLVVQAPAPALFITDGPLLEGGEIAIRRHRSSLACHPLPAYPRRMGAG
jgi:hypothetical protein